jgi:hypothetical protein
VPRAGDPVARARGRRGAQVQGDVTPPG